MKVACALAATLHFGDIGDLRHVELGRHAGCHILAASRCRENKVAVATCDGHDLCRHVFGQAVRQGVAVRVQHFADTGNLCCCCCCGTGIAASDKDVDITAALQGGSHGVEGGTLDGCVVVFGDNERSHFRVP
jgi:hypothetical protein